MNTPPGTATPLHENAPRHRHRGRGRPKTIRPKRDYGTKELIEKRARGETTEILDLCLARSLITDQQHWCGIHLRWLYTLRYGTPSVQATKITDTVGITLKSCDPQWQSAREEEYQEALKVLSMARCDTLLLGICIFNEYPSFLRKDNILSCVKQRQKEFETFIEGLEILIDCWCKNEAQQH